MFFYRAYGLIIASEFELPAAAADAAEPHVTVRRGTLDTVAPPGFEGGCFAATHHEACLSWSDTGVLAVRGGREIVVDTIPGADKRVVRLVVLGAASAVVLHQRGFVVLHAGVVGLAGGAVAFVGGSGWGKSTMVAAMHDRGAAVVTDDIAAIETLDNRHPVAHPGVPQIKLFADSLARFGADPTAAPVLDPTVDKRGRDLAGAFAGESLPLRGIYVLAKREEDRIERLAPGEALIEMVRHTFPVISRVIELTGAAAVRFPQYVRLVEQVPVYRLARKAGMDRISDVAHLVEQHAATRGATVRDTSGSP